MAKQLDFMETLDAAERSPQLPAPATLARSTDPQSSYDAAALAVESGRTIQKLIAGKSHFHSEACQRLATHNLIRLKLADR